jgi:hypothetical protein
MRVLRLRNCFAFREAVALLSMPLRGEIDLPVLHDCYLNDATKPKYVALTSV